MPLRAPSLAIAPVRAAALPPSEPATDEYVPGISPSQPQRAEQQTMYYTSAGVPTQYTTPWTSPPSQEEVQEYQRQKALRESSIFQTAAQRFMAPQPSVDTSILQAFAPGAAPAPIETAPVMAPNGETDWTTIALVGGGVLALGAAAWFLLK